MRVGVLGPLEVTGADGAVPVGGARVRVLLTRLAVAVGRVVTVAELADALWPADEPVDRAGAVRTLVSRLRRVLPDPSALRSAAGGYRLHLPADAVDAFLFDRLAREGRRALDGGDPVTAARVLGEALALWRGPALADAADAPFAGAFVAGLEEARLTAVEDRAEADLACGRSAVPELERLAVAHPLRERLHGLLVKALHAQGRQAEALAAYERIRQRLAEELGADPGPGLREIHLAVLRGDPERPRTRTGNLRMPLTSFVGREQDVARVGELLAGHRLVTLVGPGGAGKTRLATTVGAQQAGRFPGGVWLVELAAVTDPAEVPAATLAAVGLLEDGPPAARPRDVTGRLVEVLSRAPALLVLDNCEHVVAAAARLAEELLGRCAGLRVLATGREPLGIFGEVLHPVAPLALPVPQAPPDEAAASPAVRLLADRAAAVRPGFTVDEGNAAEATAICRRLDGLPLAIELAAARLRSLTPAQLAARLDDRFRLLTGGSRTALPRHQTLHAVVSWSWDLLEEEERWFAERLAVFPAGIGVAAAERVCAPGPPALDLLAALVDKSLLQVVDAPEPRYRMLETIREYGLARLAESGELDKARAAHVAYFLELAETAEPHLRSHRQLEWLARLETERDNLLAALHFAADAGDAGSAVRLAAALWLFWMVRGRSVESVEWLRTALDVPGEAPPQQRAVVGAVHLITKALAGGFQATGEAVELMRPLVAAAEDFPDHPLLALLEPAMAMFTDDAALATAAVARRSSHPDPWTRAMMRMLLAAVLENDGDQEGARRELPAVVADFRETGDRWGLSQALATLAELHLAFGEIAEGIAALEESIRVTREINPADPAGHQRVLLAQARAWRRDTVTARAELLAIAQAPERDRSARNAAFARLVLGDLARREGDLDEAGRQYETALSLTEEAPFVPGQFRALLVCAAGRLALARDRPAEAARHIEAAIELAVEAKDMPVLSRITMAAADLRAAHGDPAGAAELVGMADRFLGVPNRGDPDVGRLVTRLRLELGDAPFETALHRGGTLDRETAIALLRPR